MQHFEEIRFERFDQVSLRTVRNVKYLSAPPGVEPSPKGVWSVAAVIPSNGDYDLLLVQHTVTIRIPAGDVLKVAAYDLAAITANFGRLTDGQGQKRR